MVDHGGDAGVGPDILGGLYHVDDGVDGQNDAQDSDGRTYARHQREGEEITPHGNTGIADGGDDGNE